ncbi:hypothetical protein HYR99_28160 [Candidatus Poribacteria bacterium]|nr:hypothetical protein [Candidatus Poribacteria bacterium]
MAYRHFTLEKVVHDFQLSLGVAVLFEHTQPIPMSERYASTLAKGFKIALPTGTEKVRNELLVMPILLELQDLNQDAISIHSGIALNVDRKKGLVGECDFLLSLSPIQVFVETPIITLVEAKKKDIETGLGQCAAQMVAARILNQRRGKAITTLFGCVTTGDVWQFLKLTEGQLILDEGEYFIRNVDEILGVLQAIINFFRDR